MRGPDLLAYSRPAGARVARLRSPILPTAPAKIAARPNAVQPRITPGGSRSSGRSDKVRTADVSTVPKMRTFLLLPDRGSLAGLLAPVDVVDCGMVIDRPGGLAPMGTG